MHTAPVGADGRVVFEWQQGALFALLGQPIESGLVSFAQLLLFAFMALVGFFAIGLTKDPKELPSQLIDRPLPGFLQDSLIPRGSTSSTRMHPKSPRTPRQSVPMEVW